MSKTYTPTPEDIAKREARKAEKAAKKAQVEANGGVPPPNPNAPKILKREWVDVAGSEVEEEGKKEVGIVTVATWNMLAQTLVREYKKKVVYQDVDSSSRTIAHRLFEHAAGRDLFPGSDCLKFKDRSDMLSEELLEYPADIICLQVRVGVLLMSANDH
jgi:RNA exonuclease NGL2